MSQLIESHTIEEMVQSIASYLPGGDLFIAAHTEGTNQNDLLRGIGFTLLDAENFLAVYNSEFIPDTTTVFIEEWESALGIPDGCFPGPDESDLSIRRLHILVKLASLGVQTVDDFVNLATIMGFPSVEVIPGVDFNVQPIEEARFTIVVRFPGAAGNSFPLDFAFTFGTDQFDIIECLFRRLKPANCNIIFTVITGLPLTLLELPLVQDLRVFRGVGTPTFTRASIATYLSVETSLITLLGIDQARFETNGLLIEGASTNEALWSRDLSNAAWVKTNITAVQDAVGNDGLANGASTLTATAANGTAFQAITLGSSEYTYSVDVRRKTGAGTIEITDDGGSTFTDITGSLTSSYLRFQITTTQANPDIGFRIVTSGDEIEVDYNQLEDLPFASSRISTTTTSESRSADIFNIQSASNFDETQGTIALIVDILGSNAVAAYLCQIDDGSDNNRYALIASNLLPSRLNTTITSGGVGQTNYTDAGTFTPNVQKNIAFTYKVDDIETFVNTVSVGTDTNADLPVGVITINIGNYRTSGFELFGHIKNLRTFDVILDSAEIALL